MKLDWLFKPSLLLKVQGNYFYIKTKKCQKSVEIELYTKFL